MVSYAVNPGDLGSPVQNVAEMPSPQVDMVTLRRSGKQPLRFKGRQIIEATGYANEGRMWHEINIWSKVNTGEFVVDLRVFKKKAGEKDIHHAETVSSIDEAVAFLEGYDPKQDVAVNVDTDDASVSTAELTFKAVALRQRLEEAERLYGALIGDLFFQLDTAEESIG